MYVAPERFVNERFCQAIQRTRISLFAVDEAHCISEWGHNFRPDYLRLARFAQLCRAERVLALTATATQQVLADICRFFHIEPHCAVRTGFYRPNLTLLATPAGADSATRLVFRGSCGGARRGRRSSTSPCSGPPKSWPRGSPPPALPPGLSRGHGGRRPRGDPGLVHRRGRGIVVATIAFGMGIDKADIRYVYHYNPPKSLENYAQEIGRAGRDGRPSTCEMFFCPEDLNVLENFAYGDTPTLAAVEQLVRRFSPAERISTSAITNCRPPTTFACRSSARC